MRHNIQQRGSLCVVLRVVACVLVLVLSVTVLAPKASSPETYQSTIEKLDEKQTTVLEVAAVASASSIALAAFPDDATTPVANKIMDLAGYLVLVLCAIVMEKYMLTLGGYFVFRWMLPAFCILLGLNTFLKNQTISRVAAKILVLGLALVLVVPVSVRLSDMIQETYEVSIETTLEKEELSAETQYITEEMEQVESEPGASNEETTDGNWLKQATHGLGSFFVQAGQSIKEMKEAAEEAASLAIDTVKGLTDETIAKAQDMMRDLVETVVVLLVVNCLLPVLVMVFLLWVINLVMGIQLSLPDPRKVTGRMHKKNKEENNIL